MGREVRRIAAGWQHPKDKKGHYIPLLDGFAESVADWEKEAEEFTPDEDFPTYESYAGEKPKAADYMPEWSDEEKTHLVMYENTSEGTPISPAFETPEELARWLTDNKASACGSFTATYEQWLATCRAGYAPSMVMANGRLMSGVEAMGDR